MNVGSEGFSMLLHACIQKTWQMEKNPTMLVSYRPVRRFLFKFRVETPHFLITQLSYTVLIVACFFSSPFLAIIHFGVFRQSLWKLFPPCSRPFFDLLQVAGFVCIRQVCVCGKIKKNHSWMDPQFQNSLMFSYELWIVLSISALL